jgi:hypothetical protein
MKKLALVVVFAAVLPAPAFADQFQVFIGPMNESVYAAVSSIRVLDARGREVYKGYTDRYGRITVQLANGEYTAELKYRDKTRKTKLTIDGGKALKRVHLTP